MAYQEDIRNRLTQVADMGSSATGFAQKITDVKVANAKEAEAKKQADLQAKAAAAWQKKQELALSKSQKEYQRQTQKQTKQIAELTRQNSDAARQGALGGGGGAAGNPGAFSSAKGLMATAASLKGVPYKWGGNTVSSGLDCSGYVRLVYGKYGVNLPRTSASMAASVPAVNSKHAQPGDLVFFARNGKVHHVGIYAGNGKMWNSPHTGSNVRLDNVWRGTGDTVTYGRPPQSKKQLKATAVNAYGLAILSKMGQG